MRNGLSESKKLSIDDQIPSFKKEFKDITDQIDSLREFKGTPKEKAEILTPLIAQLRTLNTKLDELKKNSLKLEQLYKQINQTIGSQEAALRKMEQVARSGYATTKKPPSKSLIFRVAKGGAALIGRFPPVKWAVSKCRQTKPETTEAVESQPVQRAEEKKPKKAKPKPAKPKTKKPPKSAQPKLKEKPKTGSKATEPARAATAQLQSATTPEITTPPPEEPKKPAEPSAAFAVKQLTPPPTRSATPKAQTQREPLPEASGPPLPDAGAPIAQDRAQEILPKSKLPPIPLEATIIINPAQEPTPARAISSPAKKPLTIVLPEDYESKANETKKIYTLAELNFPIEKVPPRVKKIMWDLHMKSHIAELTGGAMRRLLLNPNATPPDWDIATSAPIQTIKQDLELKHEPTPGQLRVFTLEDKESQIDITTFHDYQPSKKEERTLILTERFEGEARLKEDGPCVRDTTINWIGLRIKKGVTTYKDEPENYEIVDHTGLGINDLEFGIIRTIGDPNISFQRNWTRMICVIYQAFSLHNAQNNYFRLHIATSQAIKENSRKLESLRQRDNYLQFFGILLKIVALETPRRRACIEQLIRYKLWKEMCNQIVNGFNQLIARFNQSYLEKGFSLGNIPENFNELLDVLSLDLPVADKTKLLHAALQQKDLLGIAILLAANANPVLKLDGPNAFDKLEKLDAPDLYKVMATALLSMPITKTGSIDPKKLKTVLISLLNGSYLKTEEAQKALQQRKLDRQQRMQQQRQTQPVVTPSPLGNVRPVLQPPVVIVLPVMFVPVPQGSQQGVTYSPSS